MADLLVINAGSSSIKFALFSHELEQRLDGAVTEIGGHGQLRLGDETRSAAFADHEAAIAACLEALDEAGHSPNSIMAAAHRIVHGGRKLTAPCRITADVEAEIEACVPLAPLHNPANLAAVRALRRVARDVAQYASFDTGFHATNPEVALRYAISDEEDARGIRRYGFHGISFASLTDRLPQLSREPLPRRLLAFHLGNGASICAIADGQSVATTMGYSPLDGLTMGTRCGAIDANAVLRLAADHGIEETAAILNTRSGLKALGGASDMRALKAADTERSRFAIDHFCYWALRHAGSLIAAMDGLDAIAFTGGIGENDAGVHERIMAGLAWTGLRFDVQANQTATGRLHAKDSSVAAWIVPAQEERRIAADALALARLERGG